MNVVCIIQTRMGSTRLPGKVLKQICRKTVLEHVTNRLKKVKSIDKIVIATTVLEKDNVIVKESERLNIDYFRGSEENVLSRYYYAAKEYDADVVVRITSDCPLIDSKVTEDTIQFYLDNMHKYDYVSNTLERTFPRGLDTEVFSFKALEKAFNEAVSESDKEHVTPYIWSNSNKFKLGCYKNDVDYSHLRWTLDTIEDFDLIKKIYFYLHGQRDIAFNMNDILSLYEKYPYLLRINKKIEQKKI